MQAADFAVLNFIQEYMRSTPGDAFMRFITALTDGGLIWIVLAIILVLIPKTRPLGLAVGIAIAVEFVLCDLVIKPLVARPRPCDLNAAAQLLIERPDGYSFPSGHTGVSFAATFSLFFSKSRWWIAALVLAVLTAFSRLYLYVHFPTDVLAGAALGIFCGWIGARLARVLQARLSRAPGNSV